MKPYHGYSRAKRLAILLRRAECLMEELANPNTRGPRRVKTTDALVAMEWAIDLAERDFIDHPTDANLEHVGNLIGAFRMSLSEFRTTMARETPTTALGSG